MKHIKLFENFKDRSKIKEELYRYGIEKYTINEDGIVDVDDDVNLSNRNLDRIPFKFGKVSGDFIIISNCLESLEGSPYYVGGEFACQFNKLKNLKGSPIEVSKNFYASRNNLESLDGMSLEIGGNFYCDNTSIKELDSVSNIEGYLYCDKDVDISKFRGYCKKIKIWNNYYQEFEGLYYK